MNMENKIPLDQGNSLAERLTTLISRMQRWEPHITKALSNINNLLTFDDVLASVIREDRHFYDFDDCCFIGEIMDYPDVRVYHCFIAAGDLKALKAAEPQMTEVAKFLGCHYFSMNGRLGWLKELKHDGWEAKSVVMYKEIK